MYNGPRKVLAGHPVGEYGGEEVSSLGSQQMKCLNEHWGEEGACSVCVLLPGLLNRTRTQPVDASACTHMHSGSVISRRHFPCQSGFGQHCCYRAKFVDCDCAQRQTGWARQTILV